DDVIENKGILKRTTEYNVSHAKGANLDLCKDANRAVYKSRSRSISKSQCILCVVSAISLITKIVSSILTKSMEARGPNIPIVALLMEGLRDKCIEPGITDYLTKPLKTKQLETVLTKWISNYQKSK
ncbi:13505_t:CDS:2, partial [Cetraspora pellucida]